MTRPLTEFISKSLRCTACGEVFASFGGYGNHCRNSETCTPEARFWSKVDKSAAPDGCWLYTGFRKWDGYGWLSRRMGDKTVYLTAHRYAWILTNGAVLDGLHVLHKCDNPPCCNPAHLQLGTHIENMADMKAKGRANSWNVGKPLLHPDRVRPVRKP